MNRFNWLVLLAGSATGFGLPSLGFGATAQDGGDVVGLGGLKSRAPAGWVAVRPDRKSGATVQRRSTCLAATLTLPPAGPG